MNEGMLGEVPQKLPRMSKIAELRESDQMYGVDTYPIDTIYRPGHGAKDNPEGAAMYSSLADDNR